MLEDGSVSLAIIEKRKALSPHHALLVGISGIDASGKGFVTTRIAELLQKRGIKLAVISADGWLNLPHVRFHQEDLAKHFYENAIRFDEMFERVILPLRGTRNVNVESDFTEETATTFRKHRYAFRNIDILLLEGIFLFKPIYRDHFDLKVWIDCSFATALRRAMARGQEGLAAQEAKRAFETIYFPAQRIHLARDNPRKAADIVFTNEKLWPAALTSASRTHHVRLTSAVRNQHHYLRGEAKEKEQQNAGGDDRLTQWRESESAHRDPGLGERNAPAA
jgi:uridine kinase